MVVSESLRETTLPPRSDFLTKEEEVFHNLRRSLQSACNDFHIEVFNDDETKEILENTLEKDIAEPNANINVFRRCLMDPSVWVLCVYAEDSDGYTQHKNTRAFWRNMLPYIRNGVFLERVTEKGAHFLGRDSNIHYIFTLDWDPISS